MKAERIAELRKVIEDATCPFAWWASTLSQALNEIKRLRVCLDEIESVASGEEQVADNDTEGLEWIRQRCITAKTAGGE